MRIFGLINFANVLPLRLFLRRAPLPSAAKMTIWRHSAAPSALNFALAARRVDAVISSSIASAKRGYFNEPVGICASGAVLSVLVDTAGAAGGDALSATSNALAGVLGVRGRVKIGDRALREWCEAGLMERAARANPRRLRAKRLRERLGCANGCAGVAAAARGDSAAARGGENGADAQLVDLCGEWAAQTGLPFAFARFSARRPDAAMKDILNRFARASDTASQRRKIARYVALKEAAARGISPAELKKYLEFIYYRLGKKEAAALRLYLRKIRAQKMKNCEKSARKTQNPPEKIKK